MKSILLRSAIVGIAFTGLLTGCDRQSSTTSNTLFVDPVAVAKALGQDDLIQDKVGSAVDQLNQQLNIVNHKLSSRLQEEKEKLGEKPSEQELKKFRALTEEAARQLRQQQLTAKLKAEHFQKQLVGEFRKEIRESALEIASSRKSTSVMLVGENILWFSPQNDITDEVIADLRAREALPSTDQSTAEQPANDLPGTKKQVDDEVQKEIKNLEKLVNEIDN